MNSFHNNPEEDIPNVLWASSYQNQSYLTIILTCPDYVFTTHDF